MEKQSVTITGLIITILSFVVQQFNIDIPLSEIDAVVTGVAGFIGIIVTWYGRYRQGDITVLGQKKAA